MKKCTGCKKTKSLNEFKTNKQHLDGRTSQCRDCHRKLDSEYQKNKRLTIEGYKTEEFRRYREKYPEKYKAQQKVNRAIKNGKIKRSPCELCGKKKVHAHHPDYSKPYEVQFLCPPHHKLIHNGVEPKQNGLYSAQ